MLKEAAIHEVGNVCTGLLTLNTSCRMYNSFEEALTGVASKVLEKRAGGKLQSGKARKRRGGRKGEEVK